MDKSGEGEHGEKGGRIKEGAAKERDRIAEEGAGKRGFGGNMKQKSQVEKKIRRARGGGEDGEK